ncbi:MAG: four helix bundle protein [Bacteroidetes bacterium]|nr:four helix bundle protein [Bacteroidota bacterium]
MKTIKVLTELKVWSKARMLSKRTFMLTNKEPFSKDFGLRNQINRSSGSVMDNIAEGFGRSGNKEFAQFLFIAKGSLTEVQSQLYRALDRNYLTKEIFKELEFTVNEIHKMIYGLAKKLKQADHNGIKSNF